MENKRTTPFAGTPFVAGCILAAIDDDGVANLWEITKLLPDGQYEARCPFNRNRVEVYKYAPGFDEWVGPDLPSVMAYLRLMGIKAQ